MANKDFFYDQFRACKTVEEAKSLYRKLSKQYHPDLGGDIETFKVLGNVFEDVIKNFVFTAFSESGDRAKRHSANIFADILAKIIKFNITIEIIGFWIYAFNSYEYWEQLKDLGFWFSRKHKA